MENFQRKVIAVDLDGTLCLGTAWDEESARNAEPRTEIIEKVNQLFEKNFIVIYTARRDHLLPSSLEWLRRNNVRYHAISNLKVGAELYLDDHSITEEKFMEL